MACALKNATQSLLRTKQPLGVLVSLIMFSGPVTFAPNCATASAKQFATQPEGE